MTYHQAGLYVTSVQAVNISVGYVHHFKLHFEINIRRTRDDDCHKL